MFRIPPPRRRIVGVDHVSLPVTDLAIAERFYGDLLGGELLERVDRGTWLSWFPHRVREADSIRKPFHVTFSFGNGPKIRLFLQRQEQSPLDDHPHVAFQVAADSMLPMQDRLEGHGVPTTGCIEGRRRGQASLQFLDPFGNHLELVALEFSGRVSTLPDRDADAMRLALVYQWPAVPRLR